jgi:Predicted transcriptional regulators
MEKENLDKKIFGKKLKELRKANNMTLEEFGKEIDLSPKSVSQIETGRKSTSIKTLGKICDRFQVSAAYFLPGEPGIKNLESEYEELFQNILKLPEGELRRFSDYIKLTLENLEKYK